MKKRRVIISVLFSFFLFGFITPSVEAKTEVEIFEFYQDFTMTKEGSPYIVRQDIFIAPTATIFVEPGVVVKFDKGVSMTIMGSMIAKGTADDPIYITSLADDSVGGDVNGDGVAEQYPFASDWGGVLIGGEESVIDFEYVEIRYLGGVELFKEEVDQTNVGDVPVPENPLQEKFKDLNVMIGVVFAKDFRFIRSSIKQSEGMIVVNEVDNFKMNFSNILVPKGLDQNSNKHDDIGVINLGNTSLDFEYNYWSDTRGPVIMGEPGEVEEEDRVGFHSHIDYDNPMSEPFQFGTPKQPVIIIPGIMGSYLHKDDEDFSEVWVRKYKMMASEDDEYLDALKLNSEGAFDEDLEKVVPGDILRDISVGVTIKNYFKALIEELEDNGYQEGRDLFVFGYDWRLDIDWVAGDPPFKEIKNLKAKVIETLGRTKREKVDLVAHSMGGLVAKKYIHDYGQDLVDKFINIGTPHLGAPKAFKILQYGDSVFRTYWIFGLNKKRVKIISQNMPAVYQLLPSEKYFELGDVNFNAYVADTFDIDGNGEKGSLSHASITKLMKNTGRNNLLLDKMQDLHDDIDDIEISNSYNIVGCGEATMDKFYILNKEKSGGYEYGIRFTDGDGTVPLRSASSSPVLFASGKEHSELPSQDGVREYVVSILKNRSNAFDDNYYEGISRDASICGISGTVISFHSPIDLHIYDEQGRHVGPLEDSDMEIEIPGVQYEIIDGNKFAFLPDGLQYKIEGIPTGLGLFNTRIQKIKDGIYKKQAYFNELKIQSMNTRVEIDLVKEIEDQNIKIDQDGDGEYEEVQNRSSIVSGNEVFDITKPITVLELSGERDSVGNFSGDVSISLEASDDSGILETRFSVDSGVTWEIFQEDLVLKNRCGTTSVIKYYSIDSAGNIEEEKSELIKYSDCTSEEVTIESVMRGIEKYYQEGKMRRSAERQLINHLKLIKKQSEWYEKLKKGRSETRDRMVKICENFSFNDNCKERYTKRFEKSEKWFFDIYQRSLERNFEFILKRLEFFKRRKWVDLEVYDILKVDIEKIKKLHLVNY